MAHRAVNEASIVVSLRLCSHGCAPQAEFLWRNGKPIEPLRLGCSANIGQDQQSPDAVGDRYRDIDPVGRVHRTAKLQLIGLACYGRDAEDNVRGRNLDSGNLIDWIRRRVEGNSQFEHGIEVVRSPIRGRPVEIPIAALHQPGVWTAPIARILARVREFGDMATAPKGRNECKDCKLLNGLIEAVADEK